MNEADLKAKLKVEEMRPGCMSCVLKVDEDFRNLYDTLHGGAYVYLAGTHQIFFVIIPPILLGCDKYVYMHYFNTISN